METANFIKQLISESRELNTTDIMNIFSAKINIVMSWGPSTFKNIENKIIFFTVDAFKFKGTIILSLNSADLFNIVFISDNKIYSKNDVFLMDLVDAIDNEIEFTDEQSYADKVSELFKQL